MSMVIEFDRVIEKVMVSRHGRVWHAQLSDARRRNAIDIVMRERLAVVLGAASQDPTCRAIVLSGAGSCFSAGGEISSMNQDDGNFRRRLNGNTDVIRRLLRGPVPVLAAVDGFAYGAAVSYTAACDYVVASNSAQFCCSFGSIGLIADAGLHWTLPRRVGHAAARRMLLFGETIDAATALRMGLVDSLSEAKSAVPAAIALGKRLAERAPLALALTKTLLERSHHDLDTVMAAETLHQQELFRTQDFANARQAFLEKTTPTFEGH
jgi:Enoyl-CoA hydratase/carnithine racemase